MAPCCVSQSSDVPVDWQGPWRHDACSPGDFVHDCWTSSFAMPNIAGHGMCCAHILRELEGLFQFGREKWARNLARLLSGAVHECKLARGRPLSPATMRAITDSYDRIVEEGFRYHEARSPLPSHGRRGRTKRRKAYNLLRRLRGPP